MQSVELLLSRLLDETGAGDPSRQEAAGVGMIDRPDVSWVDED